MLDETGILYISDEVQTGWGRTGEHFWGYQAHGVVPDLLTFAKGIGNGLALAGVVGRAEVINAVAGHLVLHVRRQPALDRRRQRRHRLPARPRPAGQRGPGRRDPARRAARRGDRQFGIVGDVRGKGLMLAIEFVEPGTLNPNAYATARVFEECKRRGLLVGKGGLYGNTHPDGPAADADRGRGARGPGDPARRD